jgi:peptidase M28-like protein
MRHRLVFLLSTLAACASSGAGSGARPLTLPIADNNLRRDLFAFADDSLQGRETGTPGALRAARFLVQRLVSLGIEPAGDSLYLQRVPLIRQTFAPGTRMVVRNGQTAVPLGLGTDVVPLVNLGPGAPLPRRNAEGDVFFAGYGMNTDGRNDFQGASVAGRVIVMLHGAPPSITDSAKRARLESQDELGQRIGRAIQLQPAAIVLLMTGGARDFYQQAAPELMRAVTPAPGDQTTSDAERSLPMVILGLARPGSPLLPDNWQSQNGPQLLAGRRMSAHLDIRLDPFTSYNVVGIIRGSDPRFNKSYVAFGAHYDHIGIQTGSRPDSIANGADDDGSGSVTMLAIAKSLVAARPRRSTLLVWHTGEEKGLLGSSYFVDHSTVPIDSIVAQINMDMVGRNGGSTSGFDSRVSGASAENRLYVVGPGAAPNGQSRTLGAILDTVNTRQVRPLTFDRTWDSPTHPERIYFRSDHFNYARKGIPVLFLTTGLHEDYHKVSDEASKINYAKMARIASLLLELGATLGNRETRPR